MIIKKIHPLETAMIEMGFSYTDVSGFFWLAHSRKGISITPRYISMLLKNERTMSADMAQNIKTAIVYGIKQREKKIEKVLQMLDN